MGDGSKWAKRFKNDIKNRELEVLGLRKSSRNPQEKQQKSSGKAAEILRKRCCSWAWSNKKSRRKVAKVTVISSRSCRDFLKKLP